MTWQPYYRSLGHGPGECPVADAAYESLVSLPMFPAMTDHDVDDVVRAIRKVRASPKAPVNRSPNGAAPIGDTSRLACGRRSSIGAGHLMRCLALARALSRYVQPVIATTCNRPELLQHVERAGIAIARLGAAHPHPSDADQVCELMDGCGLAL